MSSSEEENFDLDAISGDESDGYSPAPKKVTKATTKKAANATGKAIKPSAKSKSGPRKKVLAPKDENADDVRQDDCEDVSEDGVSQPAVTTNGRKDKTASEMYKKLTQLEHILKRPDSYIGSVETITQPMWTYDSENNRMTHREVKYVPGFFKIVDEILVNAADNKINDPSMDTIKVNIDVEEGIISVYNNGRGIPIEMHSKEKMYIPELIFGHLLSSSNYDDDEKKLTGGRNGYGAKLANIYSLEFTVDTADKNTGLKYKQTWTNNMNKCGTAKITKNGKGEEYTRVTFKPDLKRYLQSLLKRRVYDLSGTVKNVKVFLNDERLKIKNFKQYVELYLSSAAAEATAASGGAAQGKPTMIHEQISDRWEVAFAVSDGTFQQVSFANSIATIKGGTHVNLIADQIAKSLINAITKKNKGATVKPAQIKNHMWIFVNALVENPTFDSQTKETLTLTASKFGTKPLLSEDFMKKVSIVDQVLNWAKFKADQQIKKTDGSKRNRLTGMTKLADANNAGTRYAERCTLILTEGDSAKALAVAGLGVVGRDYFGVFPLRGKLLNVREAKHDQIMKNEEIQNIKKIMGLQHNKEYSNVNNLRYGRLMIMTDQDHDGSHIKGLLINFLDHFFPSLLKVPNFLVEFVTPIVRVSKGKQRIDFFTIPEYEQWLENTPDAHKWDSKYYKGLGTSKGDRDLIELAFSKKKADERKEWLRQFKPGTYLDHNMDEIPFSDFINKELILFSMADNVRSIPSVADGPQTGPTQSRLGLFQAQAKERNKVAAYHHGEASLTMTIVNLAQDYVGSNNVNLLLPNGQYGTRDQGGKDHASARYIFTELSPEDNDWIEPEYYMPVIPLVLVNGAEGIGTGWSTNVPLYNPVDIVENLRRLMAGEEMTPMLPWWRGFKGTIRKVGDHKYDVTGVARKINDTTVEITELPIHKWTQTYKAELEAMIGEKGDGVIKDYKEHHDNVNVHFVVTMAAKDLEKAEQQGLIEFFKLTGKVNTGNMICFNFEGKIQKYDSPEEIIEEFYPKRLAYYQKRKDFLANELQTQFERLSNQARFVKMIVDKELVVSNRKKADIVADLRKLKFRPFPKVSKAKAAGETEEVVNQDEDAAEAEAGEAAGSTDYDYLLGMAIWSLTKEKPAEKEAELLALLERTPKQLWNEDLDNFLKEWEKSCQEYESRSLLDANGKKIKKKQATLEHRKSLTNARPRKALHSDDSEDDFKPTKAVAKKKVESKPKPKPAIAGPSKIESEDEKPAPAPKKAAVRNLAKKKEPHSDSDLEITGPPPKKVVKASKLPDSDSDIEMAAPAPSKGKGKAETQEDGAKRKSYVLMPRWRNCRLISGLDLPRKMIATTRLTSDLLRRKRRLVRPQ
ncbi:DNA topoisomerase II [Pisolithus albus]|nr:DNA topoisomerase II [Pisolithus albus]